MWMQRGAQELESRSLSKGYETLHSIHSHSLTPWWEAMHHEDPIWWTGELYGQDYLMEWWTASVIVWVFVGFCYEVEHTLNPPRLSAVVGKWWVVVVPWEESPETILFRWIRQQAHSFWWGKTTIRIGEMIILNTWLRTYTFELFI